MGTTGTAGLATVPREHRAGSVDADKYTLEDDR
jgi:hypothetical protein